MGVLGDDLQAWSALASNERLNSALPEAQRDIRPDTDIAKLGPVK